MSDYKQGSRESYLSITPSDEYFDKMLMILFMDVMDSELVWQVVYNEITI